MARFSASHYINFLLRNRKEVFLLALLISGGFFFLWAGNLRIPDFSSFDERKVQSSTKIYDRSGKILLYDVHENIRRTVIPGSEMGANIKNAAVAIEDSEFFQHKGIKPSAIVRATIIAPLTGGGVQGGSTITQQVIKNAILTPERSISRKIKEWILALKLEKVMRKDEILALYLNEAPYGGNVYGVGEASRMFFGKEPRDLTLAESAYLAALPQAPSYYSPYGNHREDLDNRKNLVLKRMRDLGFITDDEYGKAAVEKVEFLPNERTGARAMHFVLFVREYLENKYGRDALESGGFSVITTLDYDLQTKAEEIVKKYALENEKNFNAENASLVAIDPKTGQILAMVGSRDYFDENIDGNFNVSVAHRQPGSSFKPFVYATAFKKGYTPDTVLFDVKTEFQTTCTPEGKPLPGASAEDCYRPENYDRVYRGPISLRNALAQSVNIPAIKVLYLSGLRDSLKTAGDLGIKSLSDPDRYGLTLVLGGGEVSLLDMTSAYSVFGNSGVRNPYQSVISVKNSSGDTVEEFSPRPSEVLPKNIALTISDILSDDVARAPAFGEGSALFIRSVAVKTGTTNDYRDAWIIGYTPSLSVGAWAGNNDNSPMEKKVAGFIVAPLWKEFMMEALKKYPTERFEKPAPVDDSLKPILRGFWQGNNTFVVDKISGKLATEYTPKETRLEKSIKNVHTILYWVSKNDPLGPPPENPENDPQFRLWEPPVQKWLLEHPFSGFAQKDIPVEKDDVHRPEFSPRVNFSKPAAGSAHSADSRIFIQVSVSGRFPITKVDYFLNGAFIGSSTAPPFDFSFSPKEAGVAGEQNELRAVAYDSFYGSGESSVGINIF